MADNDYIISVLLPELEDRFRIWGAEYQQERDLGARGEFAGLYRKTRKLKTAIWDNDHTAPDAPHRKWREDLRTIALEIAGHALLLVMDLDYETQAHGSPKQAIWVPAPGCSTLHDYGNEGWRPGPFGEPHEHRLGVLAECGQKFPCGHNPDGGPHPVVKGTE